MKKSYSKLYSINKFFNRNFIKLLVVSLLILTVGYIYKNFQINSEYPFISAYITIRPRPTIFPEFKILPANGWQKFTTQDGTISFKYPPTAKVTEYKGSTGATIDFAVKQTSAPTRMYINISTYDGNIYNRPLEKYFTKNSLGQREGVSSEVIYINKIPFKLWYSKDTVEARTVVGITQYSIILGRNSQDVVFHSPEFIYQQYLPEFLTILNSLKIKKDQNKETVFVQDGDIFMRKDTNIKQLTNSGINFNPVLSPSGTKIAFLSQTPETVKTSSDERYFDTRDHAYSIQVVMNVGGNELQISGLEEGVRRKILGWKDDATLLYLDGDKSVKVYSFATHTSKTIAGPEKPESECFQDLGGYCYSYYFDANTQKFIIFRGGMGAEQVIRIVNLDTLEVQDLHKKFGAQDCYYDRYYHDQKLFTFMCSTVRRAPDGEKTPFVPQNLSNIHYNLETGEVSVLPYSETNK